MLKRVWQIFIYYSVLAAKEKCHPDTISITDISAEVTLQSLVDHTVQRIFAVEKENIEQTRQRELVMTSK